MRQQSETRPLSNCNLISNKLKWNTKTRYWRSSSHTKQNIVSNQNISTRFCITSRMLKTDADDLIPQLENGVQRQPYQSTFKEIPVKGKLYSTMFEQSFSADVAVCSLKEDKEGRFDLKIDGVSHHSWFRRKKDEFMEALGLPTSRRQNRGLKL